MKVIIVSAIVSLAAIAGAVTLLTSDASSIPADALVVSRIGEMSASRATHQATVLESGEVLITGGCAADRCAPFHRSVEVYDPSAQGFRSVAPMALPRASHTATRLQQGHVLVAGGCSSDGATARSEVYDPSTDRWTRVEDMTEPRCSHTAALLPDGRVFIMGGGEGALGDLATAEVFDPATSSFSSLGSMRHNHYLATRLADGRVLLTGGQSDAGDVVASAEVFHPGSGRFEPTGDMTTPRVKHAAAQMPDGRVLVVGGSDERGYDGRFRSTEIYDPESGNFSPGPRMRHGRHKIRDAVVALPSGAILVAGGATRLELYEPGEGDLVPVDGELGGPQMFATASVLEDGRVLVLGGYDERTRLSGSAWLVSSGG